MPQFVVVFATPVIYQPDHPTARRLIDLLHVHAPTAEAAIAHGIRVVQGDVTGVTAHPLLATPVPIHAEIPRDIRHEFS